MFRRMLALTAATTSLAALLVGAGAPAAHAAPPGTLNQDRIVGAVSTSWIVSGGEWLSVRINPTVTGVLTGVTVPMVKVILPSSTLGDLIVQVRPNSGGLPGGAILGSAVVPKASITSSNTAAPQLVDVTFTSAASLAAGGTYFLVLGATGGNLTGTDVYGWSSYSPIHTIPTPYSADQGASWNPHQLGLGFRTYITACAGAKGTAGSDVLCVPPGTTTGKLIQGYGGDDTIYGGPGNDLIQGGDGNDTMYGAGGKDLIEGQAGFDTADGGADNDSCSAEVLISC